MPNLAAVLKSEIHRLARRAMRPVIVPMKRDIAALKHVNAAQKRTVSALVHENARLMADLNARLAVPVRAPEALVAKSRINPKSILASRTHLGLSRIQFARLLGVSSGSVFTWEGGKAKPRSEAKAALVAIRNLGRREALSRLAALPVINGGKKVPTGKARKVSRDRR